MSPPRVPPAGPVLPVRPAVPSLPIALPGAVPVLPPVPAPAPASDASAGPGAPVTARLAGRTMGTRYSVVLALPGPDEARVARAQAAVDAAVQRVDALMSTWKPESELSRLNRAPARVPFPLSAETFTVLEAAQRTSAGSEGAFDVTAGRLVNAWGFGPERRPQRVGDATRRALRRATGWQHLRLDPAARSVTKAIDGLYVDLSAIAKGFGVDEAARALDALGLHDHLVEVGGEMRASGTRADGRPWQVGLEEPRADGPRRVRLGLALRDASLATSGDYRLCFHHAGRRYSHEIDPRTGLPIGEAVAAVSVVAADCMTADAWATALIVLGPEDGPALARRLGLAAYFVLRGEGDTLHAVASPAFEALDTRPA